MKRIHIMNKREISEIKKQFKKDNNAITRICGCYVDAEKQIKTTLKEAFFALSEEEIFKYYEIFKKALSGGIGKNLHNLEYSIHDEGPDSAHELLMKLRDEKLADDETVDTFYNKVIENYEYGENYYIILIHSAYDVPGKASDNEEMFDASEEVYNHILCCICPVKLSEPGLSYNEATNAIEERPRDWWVQTPMTGFLFPAFNDRSSDIHSILYFSKNPEELHSEFIDACLGAPTPISFKSQKEAFQEILTDTLGEECDYEIVRQIHENLTELAEEHKEDEIPLTLTKPEVKDLLEKSGVEPERLEHFDKVIDIEQDLLLFDPIETWKKTKLSGGTYTVREILVPVFKNGECIYKSPTLKEIASYCCSEKDTLWDETKRLFYPHRVYVDLSKKLYDVKKSLLDQMNMTD